MDDDNSLVLRLALLKKTVSVLHGWVVGFFSFPAIGASGIHSTEKSPAVWKLFQPVLYTKVTKQYKVR